MTRIRCITMQKNEADLLEPWLLWHGALFGFENLTVIDNGSTEPNVKRIQNRYKKRGVTVINHYKTYDDFLNKGAIFQEVIQKWDQESNYDFALPMDCDEFIAVFLDRLSVQPDDILAEFANLKNERATLVTDRILLNVPNAPGYFRPQNIPRALFHAQTIEGLDRGLHSPISRYHERCVRTPFVYLHLHNRPDYEAIKRFARQKLNTPDGATPEQLTHQHPHTQAGHHLFHFFQRDQAAFLEDYQNHPDIYAPSIITRFQTLGIDPTPLFGAALCPQFPIHAPQGFMAHRRHDQGQTHEYVLFDALAYAHNNQDVAADAYYGIWPLIHFMDAGWHEGRAPNPEGIPPLIFTTQH
ncbi:glycosyltransferase family 2 protein [Neokomagataea thailandica]|uniref:Glycosyltransferase n=1 Tax=Neokomagataea tanensis NBRC 106556 TaxID=1223519 RepID=A0ABQ0QFS8_9PROT|nr:MULTISPECIES: glycosyltransferase family 2 protein [Neokomagataea]GBR43323.1 glycosyltransferase [Neokomagataea tanensis NBRC 106556]